MHVVSPTHGFRGEVAGRGVRGLGWLVGAALFVGWALLSGDEPSIGRLLSFLLGVFVMWATAGIALNQSNCLLVFSPRYESL